MRFECQTHPQDDHIDKITDCSTWYGQAPAVCTHVSLAKGRWADWSRRVIISACVRCVMFLIIDITFYWFVRVYAIQDKNLLIHCISMINIKRACQNYL